MARYIDADKIDYTMASVYWGKDDDGKDLYRRSAVAFERDIDEMPAAEVAEVKYGEWIRKGNEKKCSVCGFVYYSNNDEWNGCPNCLAKMDGGKAE